MAAAYCARSATNRAPRRRAIALWSIPLVVACLLAWEGLCAPTAHAVDRCVDPGNPGACFGTIQAAVDAAASGDTITVAAGTYVEHIDISGKALSIIGAGPDTTVVDGSNTGRVFYADADLALAELTVQNGDAGADDSGGGIAAESALTLTNVQVLSNTAGLDGGGAAVGGAATIIGGVFSANRCTGADCGGGGLYAGESLTLTGAQFLTNTAQVGGGGAATNGAAILNGGLFQGNRCSAGECTGGGLITVGMLSVTGTLFVSNTATSSGGGAATTGAAVLNGGLFQGNRSTADYGQGGGLITAGALMLTGTHFLTNTAFLGGGAVAVGAVALNGGLFQGNRLTSNICEEGQCPAGGGLYTQATLALTDTQFLANAAGLGGGAFASKAATLNGGLFQGNTALIYCEEDDPLCGGGGLYAQNTLTLTGTQFLTNAGAIGGGAVVIRAASLNGGLFQDNRTTNECETDPCGGGGLYAMGNLALVNTQFVGNSALMGGGATVAGSAILNGGLFYGNRTSRNGSLGGGIFSIGRLVITATQFISNTANDGGGAVAANSAATVQGALFESNACTYSECGGGGLNASGDITLSDTIFNSNTAVAGGGAVVTAGQATVTRSLFQSNACTGFPGFGGGLYAASGATLIESQFISNTASLLGGGAHIEGQATLTGNQFRGNSSGMAGGGVGIAGQATLNGDVFQENSSRMSGGGLYRESAVVDDKSGKLAGLQGAVNGIVLNGVQFISNTAQMGGGASVEGPVTLTGNQFRGNNSSTAGGGVAIFGLATLNGGVFQENSSGSLGGGLYVEPIDVDAASGGSASLQGAVNGAALNGVQFISNTAQAGGGGAVIGIAATLDGALFQNNTCAQAACRGGGLLSVQGALTVNKTLFLNNRAAGAGGGLHAGDLAHITNSTLAANSAATGGGLYNTGALTLTNNTLAANSATTGGGVHNKASGQLWLRNTLIAGSSGGDCTGAGAIVQNANNLVQDGSCAAALSGDPILAPLADYGGGTQTLALLPGSPAIDAADGALCPAADQRGAPRSNGACDIGAFESGGFQIAVTGGSPQTTTVNSPFAAALQAVVSAAPGEPVGPRGVITLTPPPSGAGISLAAPFTLTTDAAGAAGVIASANTIAGSYGVTVSASGILTPAVFALTNAPLQLIVAKSGDGAGSVTSEPPLIDCGLTCTVGLNYGVQMTLTATAHAGSTFTGWAGGCAGSSVCTVTMTANQLVTATFQVAPAPIAVNDAGGALDTAPATIAVTANDRDYAGGGLIVTGAGSPLHGVAAIAPGAQAVVYTAGAGYAGPDSFTYTVVDINGKSSSALVAVVVAASSGGQGQPQMQPVNPGVDSSAAFTTSTAALGVQAPAGFFTGTLSAQDVLFISFTPAITPSQQTNDPPANLRFGNLEFNLSLHLNDQLLEGQSFAAPLVLTINYDPALLGGLTAETLGLWRWNGTAWSTDGIAVLSHDVTNHTVIISLSHFSQLAFFAAAPTGLDPGDEPQNAFNLYLPAIHQE